MNNETPASATSDGARQSDACEEAIAYAKRTCHDVDVQAEHVETFLAGYDALRARILAELGDLPQLAREASDGPWEANEQLGGSYVEKSPPTAHCIAKTHGRALHAENARFIAAANPARILTLAAILGEDNTDAVRG
jgi:hypothetical protein